MKKTIIAIVITTVITFVGWDVATGLHRGRDKLWLMSAVTAPARLALDEISSDLDHGDYAMARMKLEAFRTQWKRFESENSFSSQALGNIMVEFSRLPNPSKTNGTPNMAITAMAAPEARLPTWTNAIPDSTLLTQTKLPTLETYGFVTDLTSEKAKAAFVKYLGAGWEEQTLDAETQKRIREWMSGNGMEQTFTGNGTFTNKAFPNVTVGISGAKMDMPQMKFMVIVTVIRSKSAAVRRDSRRISE